MATINTSSIFNEIVTPFRFYDSKEKRNENKIQCRDICEYKLLTPQHALLPFMIVRDYVIGGISTFKIKTANGGTEYTLSNSLIERKTVLSKDYFIYKGDAHGLFLDCGFYYAEVSDTIGNTYYSEKFYVTPSSYCTELQTNGGFDSDLSGWNTFGDITWDSGEAHFSTSGLWGKNLNQYVGTGKQVKVTFDVTGWSGSGNLTVQIGSTVVATINADGSYTVYGNTAGIGRVFFVTVVTTDFSIDNVVISEISGDSMDCSLMLEWKSDCDFGNIYYGSGFFNRLYLPSGAPLGEPTYRVTREVTTNGDGTQIEQAVKRQKVYHVELGLVPEFVVDALIDMQIHPVKKIYLTKCLGYGVISDVTVTPSWEFEGCYANVNISFIIDEIVETGCCNNLEECVECCQVAFGSLPVSTCTEGKYYVDKDNGILYRCTASTLVETPCESGYVCKDEEDVDTCEQGWVLRNNTYVAMPSVLSIDRVVGTDDYLIKVLIMQGTKAQLQVSSDGGSTWTPTGTEMTAADWENTGQVITLAPETSFKIKMSSTNDSCDYGDSCPYDYDTICTELCQATNPRYYSVNKYFDFTHFLSYNISITSILCDGVEQLSSPIVLNITDGTATSSIGLDGYAHITNITDAINAVLPQGYRVYDDMRVLEHPCGKPLVIEITQVMTYINSTTHTDEYVFDTDNGFSYDGGISFTLYSC